MDRASFSELEHDMKKRRTRREAFLEKMDKLIPWGRLEERIAPFYPKAGGVGDRIRWARCCGFAACSCSTI